MKTHKNTHFFNPYHYFSIVIIFSLITLFTGCEENVKHYRRTTDENVLIAGTWYKKPDGYVSESKWHYHWGYIHLHQKNGKIWGIYAWEYWDEQKIKGNIIGNDISLTIEYPDHFSEKGTHSTLTGKVKNNVITFTYAKTLSDGDVFQSTRTYQKISDDIPKKYYEKEGWF